MFFFAGVYDDVADYEAIKALHAGDAIGSYDSAIITGQPDGKVKVTKTEKPAHHGERHVLKREFGDFDEAEQEALTAIEQSELAG